MANTSSPLRSIGPRQSFEHLISLPTFIAGLYRDCSQTALVLGKRFGHYPGYAGKGATPSGGQIMTVPIKSESIAAARALSRRVSLVTGSTSGIVLGIARALAACGSEIVRNRRARHHLQSAGERCAQKALNRGNHRRGTCATHRSKTR
jgi:hypothetical protein